MNKESFKDKKEKAKVWLSKNWVVVYVGTCVATAFGIGIYTGSKRGYNRGAEEGGRLAMAVAKRACLNTVGEETTEKIGENMTKAACELLTESMVSK